MADQNASSENIAEAPSIFQIQAEADRLISQAESLRSGIDPDEVVQQILDNKESSQINSNETRQTLEILAKLKDKYKTVIDQRGGVDKVLEELEKYIAEDLLKDPSYGTDVSMRACNTDDFQVDQNNQPLKALDNLTEKGAYKAALRAIMDKLKSTPLSFGENKVSWDSVFHRGSSETIGASFLRKKPIQARTLLAYMWLAASDPEMDIDETSMAELGPQATREQCIEAEKLGLVRTLAACQRAHNDTGELYVRLLDNPSCKPGTWGRLFKEAPLYNNLTKIPVIKRLQVPHDVIQRRINTKILRELNGLENDKKIQLMMDFQFYTVEGYEREASEGYNLKKFSNDLKIRINQNFETEFEVMIQSDEDLKKISELAKGQGLDKLELATYYFQVLQNIKAEYRAKWDEALDKLEKSKFEAAELEEIYLPFEKKFNESIIKPFLDDVLGRLDQYDVIQSKKTNLEAIEHSLKELQNKTQNDNLSPDDLRNLTREYKNLIAQRKRLISEISNKVKESVVENVCAEYQVVDDDDRDALDGLFDMMIRDKPYAIDWLRDILVTMSESELQIPLNIEAIRLEHRQVKQLEVSQKLSELDPNSEVISSIQEALKNLQKAEKDYLMIVSQSKVDLADVEAALGILKACKQDLRIEIQNQQDNYIQAHYPEISDEEKDILDSLFLQDDFAEWLTPEQQSNTVLQTLVLANETAARAVYIQQCENKGTTILNEAQNRLDDALTEYRKSLREVQIQLRESVEPTKNSKVNQQYNAVSKAEEKVSAILVQLRKTGKNKDLDFHQEQIEKIEQIHQKLNADLKRIGPLSRMGIAQNSLKSSVNRFLSLIHIKHQFKVNKALNNKQLSSIKERAINLLDRSVDAQQTSVEQYAKFQQELPNQQSLLVHFGGHKENKASLFKSVKENIQLAEAYINSHLNIRDLGVDKPGLKDYLEVGAIAKIKVKPHSKNTEMIITFTRFDGSEPNHLEVPAEKIGEFASKQKSLNLAKTNISIGQKKG